MCSEFSTFSPASAASPLASNARAGSKPSRSAKSSHSPAVSSPNTGPTSPVTTTCEPSPQSDLLPMALPLMSSAAGFPAKTSAQPERAQGLPVSDPASGQRLPDWLASYDPATSSWKTSQLCLDGALEPYSETWPRSGMMRSGTAFRLPPLVPLTAGTASGLWHTPTAHMSKEAGYPAEFTRKTPTLNAEALVGMPARMWPTPCASDHRDRGNLGNPSVQRRAAIGKQLGLSMVVSEASGRLNPTWVEWLMGFPLGWTACEHSGTPSSRKSPNSSATRFSKRKRAANPIQPGE